MYLYIIKSAPHQKRRLYITTLFRCTIRRFFLFSTVLYIYTLQYFAVYRSPTDPLYFEQATFFFGS